MEKAGIADGGGKRSRGNEADPRDRLQATAGGDCTMPCQQLPFNRTDLPAQPLDHVGDQQQGLARQFWDRRRATDKCFDQIADMGTPLGRDDAIFCKMRPDRVNLRGSLPDQQMASAM